MCPQAPAPQQLNPSIAGHSSRGCKCEGSSSSIEQPLKSLNVFVAIGLRIIYSLRIIWWMSRGVVLETYVRPRIEEFLRDRGLTISEAKTRIVHLEEGFN